MKTLSTSEYEEIKKYSIVLEGRNGGVWGDWFPSVVEIKILDDDDKVLEFFFFFGRNWRLAGS